MTNVNPCLPSPQQFTPHLIKQLGKATDFKSGILVSSADILPDVIRDAGYDPDNLSQYGDQKDGWQRPGRDKPNGFDRRIWYSYRRLHWRSQNPMVLTGHRGKWGLTDAGVALAEKLCPRPLPAPSPALFHEPILKALGQATDYEPDPLSFKEILPDVFQVLGYDLAALPRGWDVKTSNGTLLAPERARWAMKNLCDRAIPYVEKAGHGKWRLTTAGIEEARRLTGAKKANLTGEFLGQRIKETGGHQGDLMKMMAGAVAKKLPISARTNRVEDHVQNCLLRLIQRDSLRERILAGKKIPDSLLSTYAVRAGYTDIRDEGKDPVARELYGARTQSERQHGVVTAPMSDPRIVWQRGDDGHAGEMMDIASEPLDAPNAVDDWIQFEGIMERIEDIVREKKPKAWMRYVGIIRMRVCGFTVKEIAHEEGVSPHRAASIVAEARRCVKEAGSDSLLMC